MKNLATLFLILCTLTIQAQRFGSIYTDGNWTNEDVKNDLEKQIEIGKENKTIPSFTFNLTNDTLIYHVAHTTDAFTVKTTFNINVENKNYCYYQEYIFDCTPCSQKHLDYFLTNNCHFLKISENKYLSNFKWKTEMEVIYKTANKDCVTVIFRHVDKPKQEYIAYYKTLRKR